MRATAAGPRLPPAGHRPVRRQCALLAAGVAMALFSAVAACESGQGGSGAGIEVIDDAGRRVALAAPPRRIVSLIPAVTEVVVALGAGDRLVARTDHDSRPELDTLPSVGGGLTPGLEALVALRPDLVIGWADGRSRSVLHRLNEVGIAAYGAAVETIEQADSTMRRLGVLLGVPERGDSLARATRAGLEAVAERVAGLERPDVLYVLSTSPPTTVGPGTFLHQVIEVAGGRNAFGDARAPWPQVALEQVVARDPDVILVPAPPGRSGSEIARSWRALPGWRELRAVREGRLYAVDEVAFHRWGPHLPVVAGQLAALLHPGHPTAAQ